MISKELQNKLKIQNNCVPIRDFLYFDKKYILTFKYKNRKIEFKYFEIENNKLKEVTDKDLLNYFKYLYEIHEDTIF